MRILLHLSLGLALVLLKGAESKFSKGLLSTDENWSFLDRFCFVSEEGELNYEFRYPVKFAVQNVYLYYDSEGQWPAVYKTDKTCLEKEAVLSVQNYQIMNLSGTTYDFASDFSSAGCSLNEEKTWIYCKGVRRFSSYRERWWYIAAGNCNSSQGLYLEYELNLTNGRRENYWRYHFSADEFFILQIDIGFFFVELLALVVSIAIAVILRARQMLHSTYKLFLVSLALENVSLLFDCIAYGKYAQNGVGLPFVKYLGETTRAASRLVFLLLLILMAKGYTITRGRLSKSGAWKITFFMTVYTLVYLSMLFYQVRVFDPADVLYLYDSPMGYGLVVMRLVGWGWFCYAIYFTLLHYPEKRGFFFRFSSFFSIWFWLGPVAVVLSNHVLPNYMREKIVNGIDNGIGLLGFLAFIFITRPSAANGNFPYHVRTTQIDALNCEDDDEDKSIALPHHTYEMKARKMDEIFTVGSVRQQGFLEAAKGRGRVPVAYPEKRVESEKEPLKEEDQPPSYEDSLDTQKYATQSAPQIA